MSNYGDLKCGSNANFCSWELPEDLFDSKLGEVRPTKPVKKAIKAPKAENIPRRSINEVDVCSNPIIVSMCLHQLTV